MIRRIEAELQPASVLGGVLARRVGLHSARLERSARQEAASLDERVRHAGDRFDEARVAEVDRLMSWIAAEPATHARALRSSPEGVDRMLGAWRAIRADLHLVAEERYSFSHQQLAENLMGRRPEDLPYSRLRALSQAVWNDAKCLEPAEREGRDSRAIRAYAKAEIDAIIADQVGELEAHRATLDLGRLALDRAGAADRALIDPSPAATLARKQEAATERALFRSLKEFRQVEADYRASLAAGSAPPAPDGFVPAHLAPIPSDAATPAVLPQPPAPTPLGSFRRPVPPAAPAPAHSPIVRHEEGPMSLGGGLR